MARTNLKGWKKEMLWLTVLYRLVECRDKIPITAEGDWSFLEDDLADMYLADLIAQDKERQHYIVTDKGMTALATLVAAFDQALKFEIFGAVDVSGALEESDSEDGEHVFDHVYDPRFPTSDDGDTVFDLRIGMMLHISEAMANSEAGKSQGLQVIDPHRVVFIQKLADGEFRGGNFWFDMALGEPHREVEEVVSSAYMVADLSEDPMACDQFAQVMYTAGMLEQRKRDGQECPGCCVPLALFEAAHQEEHGEPLSECPHPECSQKFGAPEPVGAEYECPNCMADIYAGSRVCQCGAQISHSMPAGTVVEETTETEEVVEETTSYGCDYDCWGYGYDHYGYQPYGYYDPYDPFVDMVAFGCLCAVVF